MIERLVEKGGVNVYFYHYLAFSQEGDQYNSPSNALNEGLNKNTITGRYTNGGNLFPEITEKLRPLNAESWINFKYAFGAELIPPSKPYLKFPLFTDKVLVFNQDLSSDLFAYIEDQYMEQETGGGYFTVGLPTKEELVKLYWESMLSIDEYLTSKPYANAEILIFKSVSPELIEYIK